ncbi:MAG: hypothetical protein ACLQMO_01705 [Acidobacteriaceae bacterium]
MHIHGHSMQSYAANLPSAAATAKKAAAQQAAEVRKQLLSGGLEMAGAMDSGTSFMVGRWQEGDSREQQGQYGAQNYSSASADSELEDNPQVNTPVSIWA